MKYIKQFGIILVVSLLGEGLNYLIPLPIPASIYGLVLMLLALGLKIIPVLPAGDGGDFPTNELLWFKRAGEPLTRTELRFINNLYGYFQLPVPEQYRLPISRVERSIYPPFPFAADQKIMSDERAGAEARPYETPGIKK